MQKLEVVEFDLSEACGAVVASFSGLASSKALALELSFSPGVRGRYLGDVTRVQQILSNLVGNALKFTNRGDVRVTVDPVAGGFRLAVSDTGVGIPADSIERLFEKFEQQDSSTTRRFGGTGLGLAICRELVEQMGGAIAATSELGEGSTFSAVLPLERVGDEMAAAPSRGVARPDATLRILVAEDNDINRKVIGVLLGQAGLSPIIVGDGAQAVDAWRRSGPFDLILMDVQMPTLDGPSASRQIRKLEQDLRQPRTPIIALTANAMTHQIADYLAAGMDGHVAKPIEVASLFEAINRAMSAQG